MILPWHKTVWAQLTGADRHPHGFLFTGPGGVGKAKLAMDFSRHLLPDEHSFDHVSHPDFHALIPEDSMSEEGDLLQRYGLRYYTTPKGQKPKSVISVDQIRRLNAAVVTHSHAGGNKVVFISPAERMNLNAANALLKVLEEPPSATVFILVTDRPDLLPATVRSRCSLVNVPIPAADIALAWLRSHLKDRDAEYLLRLAGGAPMLALELADETWLANREKIMQDIHKSIMHQVDVAAAAERWKSIGVAQCLQTTQKLLVDTVRVYFDAQHPRLFNPDQIQWLQRLVKRIHLRDVFPLIEKIGGYLQDMEGPLDKNLVLEDTLIDLSRLCRK